MRIQGEILFDTFFRSSLILFDGFHSGILWGLDRACGDIAALGPYGMLESANSFAAGLKENLETLGSPPPSAKSRELPLAAVGVMPPSAMYFCKTPRIALDLCPKVALGLWLQVARVSAGLWP